jgi:hypothetical protein
LDIPARLAIALLACLLLAGCGGSGGGSAKRTAATTSDASTGGCARAWHCGQPLSADDLPDAFLAWPQVKAIYKNGNNYVIYTTLGTGDYSTARDVCTSAFSDLFADGIETPSIIVLSEGGPATAVQLATGAVAGTGCSSSRP